MNNPNEKIEIQATPRRKWTPEEDKKLKKAVQISINNEIQQFGAKFNNHLNWSDISELMGNLRSPRECKDRYLNYLSLSNQEPWTNQEDKLLKEKHEEFGGNWKVIENFFVCRTLESLKNHWIKIFHVQVHKNCQFQQDNHDYYDLEDLKNLQDYQFLDDMYRGFVGNKTLDEVVPGL